MEILQTIWTALTTPNEGLSAILFNDFGIPFVFIEATVNMLLFTTILDIKYTKKQYFTYLFFSFILGCISNLLLDKPYSSYIVILIYPIIIHFVFKTDILKSLLAEIFPTIIIALLEIILVKLYVLIFNTSYELAYPIPLFRLSITLTIYLVMFFMHLVIKKLKYTISLSDSLSTHSKVILFLNSFVGILMICAQIYILCYYSNILPVNIIILSLLSLCAYFFISIFSLLKASKLETTRQNLEQAQDYNTTLKLLYDDIRTFRHDFGNILQSIGGYVESEDINGLKQYCNQLQIDCENVKSLEMLNPSIVNNPGVYSLLTAKYHKATSLGISMQIHISLNLETLNMKIYEFTRILGILLDNAIEASEQCEEKIINLELRKDINLPRQLLLIQNTYSNQNIDLERIREKGYTSKEDDGKPHGLGLWEVSKILKKSKNLNLFTTKDSYFFTQQLEIYNI